jgi:hypothetical protein
VAFSIGVPEPPAADEAALTKLKNQKGRYSPY